MFTVSVLGILATFFAWLESGRYFKHGLKISFILIFIFLALRYDYGNDYRTYMEMFRSINSFESFIGASNSASVEIGWVVLNRLFSPLGFQFLVAVTSLFNVIVIYNFLKKYVATEYLWLAVFLYIFNAGNMLTNLSAMRQNIAILIFLHSIKYIENKQIIKYALCILLAAQFHLSAYILLLVYPLGRLQIKINNIIGIMLLIGYVALFKYANSILTVFLGFSMESFNKYSIYSGGQDISTGLGVILQSVFLICIIYFYRFQEKIHTTPFLLGILNFMVIPLGMILIIIGRLGLYMEPFLMVVYPAILAKSSSKLFSIGFAFFLILLIIYNYIGFFNSPVFTKSFSNYQSVFSINGL